MTATDARPTTPEATAKPPRRSSAALPAVSAAFVAALVWGPSRPYALTLLALLTLVALHEAGHFLVARRLGATTPEFAVGFGPVLWSKRWRDTTWALRAVPLGGFVRIEGMETGGPEPTDDVPADLPGSATHDASAEETSPGAVSAGGRPAILSPGRQVLIAAAGPLANIAVAFVLFVVLFAAIGIPGLTGAITPMSDSPAAAAGLVDGDRVLTLDGAPAATWDEMRAAVSAAEPGRAVPVTVERAGEVVELVVVPQPGPDGQNRIGVVPATATERLGPFSAVGEAASATREAFVASVAGIAHLGEVVVSLPSQFTSPDTAPVEDRVLSPVGAAQLATSTADESGLGGILVLVAMVSVFLAVFNLLPIPPFDGGHILLNGADAVASAVRRRPVRIDRRKVMPVAMAVTAAVLVLGLSSIALDIVNPIQW
jgi:membrane-associated protease RseP (regulator of RpoE activity)